ncbi:insulin receptor substrate 1-like isoform X2 [Dysidea avara]|uniref:insulin receptor substrate 1-like isoform X2 n=1 Tax=Dysidea avara TaxID=196820 RepID=UPI00331AC699
MDSSLAIVNMPGRVVICGVVHVKNGKSHKKRFLRACCGGAEEQPAKLELYEDSKAANKGKSCSLELLFTKVKRIVNDNESKKLITIEMQESDGIAFYADNDTEHRKWVRFCGLLSTIPNYAIPEEPNYNLVPHDYIERFSDPGRFDAISVWVVYIISEDVGSKLGYEGLHIVAIRRNSTMNIHNIHSGKHLLAWDRDKLRRSGCIGSLVFMEAGRRCLGGPGLLWMYCPSSVAPKFRECLHNFLFFGPDEGRRNGLDAPPRSTSVSGSEPVTFDSGLNSVSPNSQSVSGSHLSTSTHQRLNGDSGISTSPPPPVNLKTHPSLRRRSHERTSSQGSSVHVQRSLSIDTTTTDSSRASQLSHNEEDLQFSCGRETPNSEHSDPMEQQSETFRARAQQVSHGKETYEYMRHPTKPRTESAPPAPAASNYVQMNPSEDTNHRSKENRSSLPPSSNYVNHVIPADMKPPPENYENAGFNALRTPPLMPKGIPDNLATIKEGTPLQQQVYENHSPPSASANYVNNEIKPASSEAYQNVSPPLTSQLSQEYENVSLKMSSSPRLSTHENVILKKAERKNSVRDRAGSLQYSEIENTGSNSPSPTNKFNRQYSDVDYQATLAVETQQKDRTLQKEQHAAQQTKVH